MLLLSDEPVDVFEVLYFGSVSFFCSFLFCLSDQLQGRCQPVQDKMYCTGLSAFGEPFLISD